MLGLLKHLQQHLTPLEVLFLLLLVEFLLLLHLFFSLSLLPLLLLLQFGHLALLLLEGLLLFSQLLMERFDLTLCRRFLGNSRSIPIADLLQLAVLVEKRSGEGQVQFPVTLLNNEINKVSTNFLFCKERGKR